MEQNECEYKEGQLQKKASNFAQIIISLPVAMIRRKEEELNEALMEICWESLTTQLGGTRDVSRQTHWYQKVRRECNREAVEVTCNAAENPITGKCYTVKLCFCQGWTQVSAETIAFRAPMSDRKCWLLVDVFCPYNRSSQRSCIQPMDGWQPPLATQMCAYAN